jgi:CheY-like chemotaxis protein
VFLPIPIGGRILSAMTSKTDAPVPSPAPADSSAGEEPDYSQSTVLIVDDNAQNLELLQAYLETLGCRIASAADGLAALRAVEQGKPDLILLDVMMPKMSGFEVCKKLKADPATRSIPILMVTALNELGDIERGVESGTDDFLTKPVKKLELLTRVKSLLRVRHLKRELDRTLAHIEKVEGKPSGGSSGKPGGRRSPR